MITSAILLAQLGHLYLKWLLMLGAKYAFIIFACVSSSWLSAFNVSLKIWEVEWQEREVGEVVISHPLVGCPQQSKRDQAKAGINNSIWVPQTSCGNRYSSCLLMPSGRTSSESDGKQKLQSYPIWSAKLRLGHSVLPPAPFPWLAFLLFLCVIWIL